jgi:hypothetical protein
MKPPGLRLVHSSPPARYRTFKRQMKSLLQN